MKTAWHFSVYRCDQDIDQVLPDKLLGYSPLIDQFLVVHFLKIFNP